MTDDKLFEVVRRLAVVFGRRHIRHALIGGLAVGVRSRPRATKDADFIVSVPALAFPALLEDLKVDGFEIDVPAVLRQWPIDRFTVFYRGDARIDWLQPVLPLYATVLATAEPKPWADSEVRIATAEGLILTKILAFRPQDQADIETILSANRDEIDLDLIRKEWSAVSEGEEARTAWLESAIVRLVPPRK
jgi:hypothetical protein